MRFLKVLLLCVVLWTASFVDLRIREADSYVLGFSAAQAQSAEGLDYLGLPKYCDAVIRAHPRGMAIGTFGEEFGDAYPCLDRILSRGLTQRIRIQGIWDASHGYPRAKQDASVRQLPKVIALARKYSTVRVEYSPLCEHNLSESVMRQLFARLRREELPANLFLVNSPWRGAQLRGEINEVHGFPSRAPSGVYNVSHDGLKGTDVDIAAWKRRFAGASTRYYWDERFNCRQQGTNPPPKERTACPDERYIRSIAALAATPPPAPQFSFAVSAIKRPNLWKTHAEDKVGNRDPRANRPLTLSPFTSNELVVRASNGREVCKLRRFLPDFAPGVARHYSGYGGGCNLMGYEIGERASRISGSPYVAVCDGSRCLGPIFPAHRAGFFRNGN